MQKRRRRDYRNARKAAFSRPEPGFPSLYEGRTRGKKLKYTYSDDEDIFAEGLPPPTRRTTRGARHAEESKASDANAPPRYSASGRPIRSRAGGVYGQGDDDTSSQRGRSNGNGYYKFGDSDDGDDSGEEDAPSGDEWQGVDEGEEDDDDDGDDEDVSGDESVVNGDGNVPSLIVQLRYGKSKDMPNQEEEGEKVSSAMTVPGDIIASATAPLAAAGGGGGGGVNGTTANDENNAKVLPAPLPAPAAPPAPDPVPQSSETNHPVHEMNGTG